MIPIVRYCTEILENGQHSPSRPITEFENLPAYVLLGNPGAGKTTVFAQEADRTDACFVPARDLIELDTECHTEWYCKTLFIDGLDEVRAGSPDARAPLDHIRSKIEKLGRPWFRLSCREADWFGASDTGRLKAVSGDGQVKILHLDPFGEDDVIGFLSADRSPADAQQFVTEANRKGLQELLENPQNLVMLAKAVSGGNWPDTRTGTFEMACRVMVREHNWEHEDATRNSPVNENQLLESAGFLCACQLIAGNAGYALTNRAADANFPCLNELDYKDISLLRKTTQRNLFRASGEGRTEPVHRQIAEYLAAEYIAGRVESGLPPGRLLALVTGKDGIVVSELRGLSAWLAALCTGGRGEIIDRDPLGVVLYGDARMFGIQDKLRLLGGLRREAKKNPWFHSPDWTTSPFGALATPDMEEEFERILSGTERDEGYQLFARCVLDAMAHGERFTSLDETLISIIRDDTWWPRVREAALDVVCRRIPTDSRIAYRMKSILEDIRHGSLTDFNDGIAGNLLTELYPGFVTPEEVFDYLHAPTMPNYTGSYSYFWYHTLSENSSDEDIRTLLDQLVARSDTWESGVDINSSRYTWMATGLLAKGLEAHGESIDPACLYQWLGVGLKHEFSRHGEKDAIRRIKSWMEDRPEIQKSVLCAGERECQGIESFHFCMRDVRARLDPANLPADYGLWCLQRLPCLSEDTLAKYMLEEAVNAVKNQHGDQGLSLDLIEEVAGRNEKHQSWLEDLLVPPVDGRHWDRQQKERKHKMDDRKERDEWIRYIKSHQASLEDGTAHPRPLHVLADVYYGRFIDLEGDTPVERLRHFLGHDEGLVKSVLRGMCRSLDRKDLPTVDEINRIDIQNKTHFLGRPVLAGLAEKYMHSPDDILQLDDSLMERAIAFYLTEVSGNDIPWYRVLLEKRPELVSRILIRYVTAVLHGKKKHVAAVHGILNALAYADEYVPVARLGTTAMLKAFPARCVNRQLELLDPLLKSAMRHVPDETLLALTGKKLGQKSMNSAQRVYWLFTALLVDPIQYQQEFENFIQGNENRTRHLANILWCRNGQWLLPDDLPSSVIELLIHTLGRFFPPFSLKRSGAVSLAWNASDFITRLIGNLSSNGTEEATDSLDSLLANRELSKWHSNLQSARFDQIAVRREVGFRHPRIGQVISTLNNAAPANAGDLAALTRYHFHDMAKEIRNGNTDDYKQYWDLESGTVRPDRPKHEDACRDVFLSNLQKRLAPLGVDAQPEGRYADAKRADIRVSVGGDQGFAVPVEIKKNTHPDLWSAIRNQLIARYTRDPCADGYGIYLVFWFGADRTQSPPSGKRPGSAVELEDRLRESLSADENRRISACVIDVSNPDDNP